MSSFYHFEVKIMPRDGTAKKKYKLSLQDSMLLCGAVQIVGTKFLATGRPKRADDDDEDDDTSLENDEDFVSRIVSLECNQFSMMEMLDSCSKQKSSRLEVSLARSLL
jgi:hypothetical protein